MKILWSYLLLLSGTHSLRTTSVNWKLYRGGQLNLSATALNALSWPLLEQRHAEARLGLFYRIVHKAVDMDATTLMTRSTRPTRKANEVLYTRHMTSKDCYKYSFIPRMGARRGGKRGHLPPPPLEIKKYGGPQG